MRQAKPPTILWDHCAKRQGEIFSVTARDIFQLNGTNPHTMAFEEKSEISNMYKFGWYKWCHYFDYSKVSRLLLQKSCLGSILGPANNEGNETTQWILNNNGNIIPRWTVKKLIAKHLDPINEFEKGKRGELENKIRSILGDSIDLPLAEPDHRSL